MSEANLPEDNSPLQKLTKAWWAEIREDERTHWMASAVALWGERATIEDAYLRYCAVGAIREVIQKVRRGG